MITPLTMKLLIIFVLVFTLLAAVVLGQANAGGNTNPTGNVEPLAVGNQGKPGFTSQLNGNGLNGNQEEISVNTRHHGGGHGRGGHGRG